MTISYNGLWKILIDKNLQRKNLKEKLKISSLTFAKMSRGETVSMDVLMRLWEKHIIDNLQQFLLELGKGFTFVGRQVRLIIAETFECYGLKKI